MYEARMYSLISIIKLQTLTINLEMSHLYRPHIVHTSFFFLLQSAMKTQLLTNQNACTIQIMLLYNLIYLYFNVELNE